MNYMKFSRHSKLPALALAVLALAATPSIAVELAAVEAEWTPPGGTTPIAMWAFVDAGADANTYSCPGALVAWSNGPALTAAVAGNLTVNIKNCLSQPVSVFIPGQLKATSPVTFVDGQGRSRVRSFDAETAAGAVGSYTWTAVKEGTYLYHSGTHPQVQVQMGLYGALTVGNYGYANEQTLVYSEIDPALHAAVDGGTYGTAAYPSTFDYKPRYFLINGAAYPAGADVAVTTGDVLLRFVNAGLKTRVPTLGGGLYMSLIAEDGNRYPFEVEQYGVELQAAKTIDAVVQVGAEGRYALYDRALGLTNWSETGGGMLTYLAVGPGPGLLQLNAASFSVAENGASVAVTVDRIGGSAGAATVDYATADGSAAGGTNYTAASGTLAFADGDALSQTITVLVTDDLTYEGDKTFSVVLSNATGAYLGSQASAVVTITEDEIQPATFQFSAATYSVAEAGGTLTVTVDRVGDDSGPVSVDYATADDSATDGADYTGAAGTLSFAATETSATFAITILDDGATEGDETFNVALSNPSVGAVLGTPFGAVVTINDDDAANVAPIANDDTLAMVNVSGSRSATYDIVDIIANDEDPDCGFGSPCLDATSFVITTGGRTQRRGTIVDNGDGTVTYTPRNNGFKGTDTFQYTVNDADGATSNAATVRINVTKAKSAASAKVVTR